MIRDALGGYLGFTWGKHDSSNLYPQAYRYQAARYALVDFLKQHQPEFFWVPWFVCDDLTDALVMHGVALKRYHLDDEMLPEKSLSIGAKDFLLYVNYFGCADRQAGMVIERFGGMQVLLDYSQALFAPAPECLATIYSPRKFLPLPDGGLLVTNLPMEPPEEQDQQSVERCQHLLVRAVEGAEAGYGHFVSAESSLDGQGVLAMSQLTSKMMTTAADTRKQRQANYNYLHSQLAATNKLLPLAGGDSPLSYPFLVSEGASIRERLAKRRIYTPVYWQTKNAKQLNAVEKNWVENVVHLPIDPRLSPENLDEIVENLI